MTLTPQEQEDWDDCCGDSCAEHMKAIIRRLLEREKALERVEGAARRFYNSKVVDETPMLGYSEAFTELGVALSALNPGEKK